MPIRPNTHRAVPGDLICAPVLSCGYGWLVLTVADVDDDGFVAVVLDEKGARVATSRVYAPSEPDGPHLIVPQGQLTVRGRTEMAGVCAASIDEIKALLRQWKADA